MTGESTHWHRVEPLLDRLLAAMPSERAQLLDVLAGSDSDLHFELSSLMAAHLAAGDFLEQPAISLVDLDNHDADTTRDVPGRVIGRYRLSERIALGGMGTV